jgi:ribosomal protein L7/L12
MNTLDPLAANYRRALTIREKGKHMKRHDLTPEEVGLLAQGKTILAIKALRERVGCMLLDAKASVDEYRFALGQFEYEDCQYCRGVGKVVKLLNRPY